MITDSFPNDLKYFHDLLKNKEPFAITRFGDGERFIMEGTPVANSEFAFKNDDNFIKEALMKSFTMDKPNYFVGVPCPCCQPKERCDWMKNQTGLSEDKLTWANIFVNSNFTYFNEEFVKSFNDYDNICFVGRGETDNLPFRVDKSFKVGPNAHINNKDLLETIPEYIDSEGIDGGLFIVSAGPFANVLVAELYDRYPNNTFIDIGSVFDEYQGLGKTRRYLSGGPTINKTCIW